MSEEQIERPDRCETCRFYEVIDRVEDVRPGEQRGFCRRYPPCGAPACEEVTDMEAVTHFPIVLGSMDWCGEWQAKDGKTALPVSNGARRELPPVSHTSLAHMLGVPGKWLCAEADAGRLPHVKADKVYLFDADLVERLLLERSRLNPAPASPPAP